jgi:hypothetical protein
LLRLVRDVIQRIGWQWRQRRIFEPRTFGRFRGCIVYKQEQLFRWQLQRCRIFGELIQLVGRRLRGRIVRKLQLTCRRLRRLVVQS